MLDLSVMILRRAITLGSIKGIQLNKKGNWKIQIEEIDRFIKIEK